MSVRVRRAYRAWLLVTRKHRIPATAYSSRAMAVMNAGDDFDILAGWFRPDHLQQSRNYMPNVRSKKGRPDV